MMEAARSVGFAARFVTGYIYVPNRDGPGWLGGGSTHAWCQIYLPGSGWVEFDPTNGIVGNRDLVRVAVARTPDQAIPLSGVYYGDRCDELGMEVEVNVKLEGPLGSSDGIFSAEGAPQLNAAGVVRAGLGPARRCRPVKVPPDALEASLAGLAHPPQGRLRSNSANAERF
jgi:hypothetical protein